MQLPCDQGYNIGKCSELATCWKPNVILERLKYTMNEYFIHPRNDCLDLTMNIVVQDRLSLHMYINLEILSRHEMPAAYTRS